MVAVIKFWMSLGEMKKTAENAQMAAAVANGKYDIVAAQLGEFKTVAAREFATMAQLGQVETRVANAVEGMRADMRSDLRGVTERLDKVLMEFSRHKE